MKPFLFKGVCAFFIFAAFISIWSFLLPEKRIQANANSVSNISTECETFKNDALAEFNSTVNAKISATLNEIYIANQANLLMISDAIKIHGSDSKEVKELSEIKDKRDEIHLIKVKDIIDKYGWPGSDKIGSQNNYTLFATIQNSDLATQEKYMPLMEKAVKSGSLAAEYYASFVDRKALVQHHQQIYGTQVTRNTLTGEYFFAPIIKEELVNQRRLDIGLSSIEEYAKTYRIDYLNSQKNS